MKRLIVARAHVKINKSCLKEKSPTINVITEKTIDKKNKNNAGNNVTF